MAAEVGPDFSGYATKANLKCSDGRVIKREAFQHMDGATVPLVWQHGHNDPGNILGHAVLEVVEDGVRAHGYFNKTPNGQNAKMSVQHGDLKSLSIYANQLKEQNKVVSHGSIREVSLVLSGANPGAKIDYVRLQHSSDPEDYTELDDEAVIHSGDEIDVFDDEAAQNDNQTESDKVEHADQPVSEQTVQDIYDSMTDAQRGAVHFILGMALEQNGAKHSDDNNEGATTVPANENEGEVAHQEGTEVSRNLFEKNGTGAGETELKHSLTASDVQGIVQAAAKGGGSLKHAVEQYALAHGIDNIEILFPDAQNVTGVPDLEKRRTEWVSTVLGGVTKAPMARIKTFSGDLTQDEARAKGYIKGHYKKEEWFGVTKRTTTPTTVYKKQKLDRDDIIDITDFDIVAFLKAEMRLMTEEEIARAILIGDGRAVEDEDKVRDPMGASDGAGIRSILNDHELFVTTLRVNVDDANSSYEEVVDAVMDGMEYYKGSGSPTFFTTVKHLNKFKKAKDGNQRRYYENNAQVAEALGVARVVTVEPLQTQHPDVIGIIVNLDDYRTGTDRGGELAMFDDFDIDYNQYKYLMETRLSGALTKPKSALVIRATPVASVLVQPNKPAFNSATGVITIPTQTGVVYKDSENNTLTAGAQTALAAGQSKTVYAQPATNYHFADTVNDSWMFKRPAGA